MKKFFNQSSLQLEQHGKFCSRSRGLEDSVFLETLEGLACLECWALHVWNIMKAQKIDQRLSGSFTKSLKAIEVIRVIEVRKVPFNWEIKGF